MIRTAFGVVAASLTLLCLAVTAQKESQLPEGPLEATSLLGRKLYALPDDDGAIRVAQEGLSATPANADLALKLSKAQAAKRQYREAVATCTTALAKAPDNAALYLERGHRELGLREFKAADADLNKAVELDPKQLDSYYHLGLAHYFLGDFEQAAQSFAHALSLAQNTDSVIDCSNWLYVSRRRGGQAHAAAQVLKRITPDMKNTEPHLYFYLRLLHFYQGTISESDVLPPAPKGPTDLEGELSFDTTNYGVGNWHLYEKSDPAGADEFFHNVVKGYAWNSWGFIGSELELAKAAR